MKAVTWVYCCCCLLLQRCLFSPRTASFPSLQPSLGSPFPHHVLRLIWMGRSKATSNTCAAPSCPPPSHQPPPPSRLSSRTISLFSFVQPILLSAVWFTQAWKTCDHSAGYQELQAGSVFGRRRKRRRRKTIWHDQPTIRTLCSTIEQANSARKHWLCFTGLGLKWNISEWNIIFSDLESWHNLAKDATHSSQHFKQLCYKIKIIGVFLKP